MNSAERVKNTILGNPTDRQPVYGWVRENLSEEISERFGSVEAFEDKYEFDAAHIFGGPWSFDADAFDNIRSRHDELSPDVLVDYNLFVDPCKDEDYDDVKRQIEHHKKRERFCYM